MTNIREDGTLQGAGFKTEGMRLVDIYFQESPTAFDETEIRIGNDDIVYTKTSALINGFNDFIALKKLQDDEARVIKDAETKE